MVCFQCGSPVSTQASTCPNCGAAQRSVGKRLNESGSQGLRRMTMELKAINVSGQLFPPGEVVAGRFRLGEMIGQGPFGQVFKAHDTLADTDVALKIFAPDVLRNPMDQERFLNATRSARALTQRNVVRLHDSGVHKDHAWISMQHLEGLSLRKLLDLRKVKGEGFSLEEIEPIIGQITLALQHIGREHPHGNLKPENIVFLPDFIKVTDSYIFSAFSKEVFRNRLEKSPYLAPELRLGADDFDARCDVYSVGQIIGEMYYGEVNSSGALVRNDALDALYKRATAEDVSARYASVEELAEDLGTLLDTGMLLQMRDHGVVVPPPPGAIGVEGRALPPLPPIVDAESDADDGVVILEEDIATLEVRRDGANLPVVPNDPELGDLLATIEADRSQKLPLSMPERLEFRQDSGRITTVVESTTPAASRKESSRAPVMIMVVAGIIALIVFAMITMKKPDNEVVSLGDGTATTSERADSEKVAPTASETEKPVEPGAAMLAANDTVPGSSLPESEEAAAVASEKTEEPIEAVATKEEAPVVVAEKSGQDVGSLASAVAPKVDDKGAKPADSTVSSSAATGAPLREPAAKPPVAKEPAVTEAPKVAAGQGLDCPAGMVLIKSKTGNYCVDMYEFPGKGSTPKTNTSWFDARKQCMSQNKRLCALQEWKQACGAKYPYGSTFNADSCNTTDEDGFDRSLAKAGSFSACRSRSGAYDMSGNVHEWVEEQRVAGGGFDSDETVASCSYSSPKAAGSSSGSIGFRCCADAQ